MNFENENVIGVNFVNLVQRFPKNKSRCVKKIASHTLLLGGLLYRKKLKIEMHTNILWEKPIAQSADLDVDGYKILQ